MFGPQWNQEKSVLILRWVLVVIILISLIPNSVISRNTMAAVGGGCFVALLLIQFLYRRMQIDRFHIISMLFDIAFISVVLYITGGAFIRTAAGGINANYLVLIYPPAILYASLGREWYWGIGAATVVNSILGYFLLSGPGVQEAWPMYIVMAAANFAAGSSFMLSDTVIVVGDVEQDKKRKLEIEKAYQALRKEVQIRASREKELQEKTSKLTTIIQVTRLLGTSFNLSDLFEVIIEKARSEMNSQMSFLMLEKNGSLEVVHSIGVSEITKEIMNCRIEKDHCIFADVVVNSTPVTLCRDDDEKAFEDFIGAAEKFKTVLMVPLKAPKDDKPIGVLGVANLFVGNRYTEEHEDFLGIFAIEASMFIRQLQLKEDLERSYFELITSLASAIEAKDPYTRGHVQRVADFATRIAKTLRLPGEEVQRIEKAAILHDVGKIATPEAILNKPGRLTDDEFTVMKEHVNDSCKMLSDITQGIDDKLRHYIGAHHERWDGMGYPSGLKGEEIPLGAQIIAVADSFDAMTSDRPYRKGFSTKEALKRLVDCAGTQFNPRVLYAFFDLMGFDKETGRIMPHIRQTREIDISELEEAVKAKKAQS